MTQVGKHTFEGGAKLYEPLDPNSLNQCLRDIADDLAMVKAAIDGSTANGVVDGLVASAPTTPSGQLTGTGNTTWNVNVSAGFAFVNAVGKSETAQVDKVIHSGSQLLTNGQAIYAWLIEKNVAGTVSMAVVKGTAATAGSEVAPSDAAITTAAGASWIKLAKLHLARTGDTTVAQTQDLSVRQRFGIIAATATKLLTQKV